MRKNRRDTKDTIHDEVWEQPSRYTRASRRASGYRERVHLSIEEPVLPRYARRHWGQLTKGRATRRVRKAQARIGRRLARYAVEFA